MPDWTLAEFEKTFPNLIPPGTSDEGKQKYISKINAERRYEQAQKVQDFTKLDTMVEQKQGSAQDDHDSNVEDANNLYKSGKFIERCTQVFQKIWYGDAHVLGMILLQTGNVLIKNADCAIHLHIAGKTQSGKSDSAKQSLKFIPGRFKIVRTFSRMWIYYAGDKLHQGMTIFSDDTQIDPELAEIYRSILTSWHIGVKRGTVIKNEARDLEIPPRINLILTSVDAVTKKTDDAQDESRFITVEVRRSAEDERLIRKFIQEKPVDISKDLDIIHKVWDVIEPSEVTLHREIDRPVPFREFKEFLTLVRSHALLCGRTTTTEEDITRVDELLTYTRPMKRSDIAGLTQNEKAVLQVITDNKFKYTDIPTIQKSTGLTISSVYNALRGRDGTFDKPSGGLMAKESSLHYMYEPTTRQHSFIIEC